MSAFLEFVNEWLVDYFLAATTRDGRGLGLRMLLRQPAARMAVAWSACLGLVALAVLTALPSWPRVALAELAQQWSATVAPMELTELVLTEPEASLPLDVAPFAANLEPLDRGACRSCAGSIGNPRRIRSRCDARADGLDASCSRSLAGQRDGCSSLDSRRLDSHQSPDVHGGSCAGLGGRSAAEHREVPAAARSIYQSADQLRGGPWGAAPKIVLPEDSVKGANEAAVRAALAHEWAHIRQGDLWLLAIERLLLPLLAVHPLFWWLRRSIRLDQELLADAAAAGDEPAEYAEALLILARTAQPARHGLPALSMWEHPSTLSRRVAMILDPKRRVTRPLSRAWTAVTVALALPAILALSVVSLRPSTAQEKPAEAAAEAPQPSTQPAPESPPPIPRSAGKTVPITQVHMELLVMSVSRDKLTAAETTLEDAIAEATESRCRKEAGLVVSEIKPEEVREAAGWSEEARCGRGHLAAQRHHARWARGERAYRRRSAGPPGGRDDQWQARAEGRVQGVRHDAHGATQAVGRETGPGDARHPR